MAWLVVLNSQIALLLTMLRRYGLLPQLVIVSMRRQSSKVIKQKLTFLKVKLAVGSTLLLL